jgi:hypothetical protein
VEPNLQVKSGGSFWVWGSPARNGETMAKQIGLWIDHRKAVIVTIDNEVEVTREIRSNMQKHVRFSSSKGSKISDADRGSSAEDMRDRQFGNDLGRYYEGIVTLIRGADSIWIFGPGEAKTELENQLKRDGLGALILGVDAADKKTDLQIAAKTREYFRKK